MPKSMLFVGTVTIVKEGIHCTEVGDVYRVEKVIKNGEKNYFFIPKTRVVGISNLFTCLVGDL
jgi:hypothetical protein